MFYRMANDDVIEVVRLLHDAMELQLHLPNDRSPTWPNGLTDHEQRR